VCVCVSQFVCVCEYVCVCMGACVCVDTIGDLIMLVCIRCKLFTMFSHVFVVKMVRYFISYSVQCSRLSILFFDDYFCSCCMQPHGVSNNIQPVLISDQSVNGSMATHVYV